MFNTNFKNSWQNVWFLDLFAPFIPVQWNSYSDVTRPKWVSASKRQVYSRQKTNTVFHYKAVVPTGSPNFVTKIKRLK